MSYRLAASLTVPTGLVKHSPYIICDAVSFQNDFTKIILECFTFQKARLCLRNCECNVQNVLGTRASSQSFQKLKWCLAFRV